MKFDGVASVLFNCQTATVRMNAGAKLDARKVESAITGNEWKLIEMKAGTPPTVQVATFRVARAKTEERPDFGDVIEKLASIEGAGATSIDALGHGYFTLSEGATLKDDALREVAEKQGAKLEPLERATWPAQTARYSVVLEQLDVAKAESAWTAARAVEKVLWAEIDPAGATITLFLVEPCSQIEKRTRAALEAAGFKVASFAEA